MMSAFSRCLPAFILPATVARDRKRNWFVTEIRNDFFFLSKQFSIFHSEIGELLLPVNNYSGIEPISMFSFQQRRRSMLLFCLLLVCTLSFSVVHAREREFDLETTVCCVYCMACLTVGLWYWILKNCGTGGTMKGMSHVCLLLLYAATIKST